MFKSASFVLPVLGFGLAALVGCSSATPAAAPVVTSTSSSSAAPTSSSAPVGEPQAVSVVDKPVVEQSVVGQTGCAVNPVDAPVPSADPYSTLPAQYGVQITIAGAPSVVTVGKSSEVELTLCNTSPVAYKEVGLVFALAQCTCAEAPFNISKGTAQRFDAASGSWIELGHPAVGTGMDYLSLFTNQQPLPKGKSVTVRYRFTFDQSMGEGDGGIVAAAVMTDGPVRISESSASFAVQH